MWASSLLKRDSLLPDLPRLGKEIQTAELLSHVGVASEGASEHRHCCLWFQIRATEGRGVSSFLPGCVEQ